MNGDAMQHHAMAGANCHATRADKALAKAEANRKKAALECAQKLLAASDAVNRYLASCNECQDASSARGADDSRLILIGNMTEYAGYLHSIYDKSA